jgi:hypothetical protein
LFPDHETTPTDFDNAVWLLYTSRVYVPGRVRAFVEFIKQQIRDDNSGLDAPWAHRTLPKNRATEKSDLMRDSLPAMNLLL